MSHPWRRQSLNLLLGLCLGIFPAIVLFGVVGLFPLLFTAYESLFDRDLLDDTGKFIGLRNYIDLWQDKQFWNGQIR